MNADATERRKDLTRRSMNPTNIVGLNRLCETAGKVNTKMLPLASYLSFIFKDLLIFQILWPENFNTKSSEEIKQLEVKEILFRRWVSSAERLKPQTD